jgi:TIR domain
MTEVAFINYRRDDAGPEARLIANALRQSLSPASVFMDTEGIDAGDEWPQRIRSALDRSRYVIVVVGPKWLHAGMDRWGRRRIDCENDWVRQEIVHALRDENKTVIPVLIGGAEMPPPEALPNDVAPVTSLQHIVLRRDYWDHDIKLLTARVAPYHEIDHLGEINPLLKPIWHHIDEDLRKIFVIAATLAKMESKNYVSTTNFVKALMFLKPGKISDFFSRLPEGALPDSVPNNIPMHVSTLQSLDSLSPCINSAMKNLTPKISNEEKLSSEDVYIDIARFATGKSTQRLRSHGVSKQDVEKIVQQLGWQLVERDVAMVE